MTLTIHNADSHLVLAALREQARDVRSFNSTLGKNDPPSLREARIERAESFERLAGELAAQPVGLMPDEDDLIDAAEELRAAEGAYPGLDTSGPSRLLEQVAAAITTNKARRDELLEGRTDLGYPEVR